MKKVYLRHLKLKDKEDFYRAINEDWESHFPFVHFWESRAQKNFERIVEILQALDDTTKLDLEMVPATFLFAFNEDHKIVGRVSIRHELNDSLKIVGGHIGYGVCPTYRRQGYATAILKESLYYIRENIKSISKALVTCDENNFGSQKTIEANQGVLKEVAEVEGRESKVMRYWIEI